VYSSSQGCHTATGTHVPHGITQCYLPPGRADIPALTLASRSWYSIKRPRRDARLSELTAISLTVTPWECTRWVKKVGCWLQAQSRPAPKSSGAVVTASASSAPTTNVQTRLDSTRLGERWKDELRNEWKWRDRKAVSPHCGTGFTLLVCLQTQTKWARRQRRDISVAAAACRGTSPPINSRPILLRLFLYSTGPIYTLNSHLGRIATIFHRPLGQKRRQ